MLYLEERNHLYNTQTKKEKKTTKKNIQEAPKSIQEKHELTKYKQHKDILKTINKKELELNIPTNLKLKGIAENFDTAYNFSEDYPTQKFDSNERYIKSTNIESDDIHEDVINPLDFVRQFNVSRIKC